MLRKARGLQGNCEFGATGLEFLLDILFESSCYAALYWEEGRLLVPEDLVHGADFTRVSDLCRKACASGGCCGG